MSFVGGVERLNDGAWPCQGLGFKRISGKWVLACTHKSHGKAMKIWCNHENLKIFGK